MTPRAQIESILSADPIAAGRFSQATVEALVSMLEAQEDKIASLKYPVTLKDRALHARNVALDGMAWVWCDGGCHSGVFRFTDMKLTDEMLAMIQRNTSRLQRWAANRDYRAGRDTGAGEVGR